MWNIGDECYIVVGRGAASAGTLMQLNGKTQCTVHLVGGTEKKLPIKRLYSTEERAIQASQKATKKSGTTEVQPFWNLEDIVAMKDCFLSHGHYHHALTFMMGLLTGRRVGDILTLRWSDIYYPNGRIKRDLEIEEQKTGKRTSTRICGYLATLIEQYIELTGIDPAENNYQNEIFPSRGKRKDAAYRFAFKKAAEECDIDYPVSTHSTRKTFGYWSKQIHPNDVNSLDILQKIFQHSDRSITAAYIGLTQESADQYMEDMGDLMEKTFSGQAIVFNGAPTITLYNDDLREILSKAFYAGKESSDMSSQQDNGLINQILHEIEAKRIKAKTY